MTHTLKDDTVFFAIIQKRNKEWDLCQKARRKCKIQSSLLQSLWKGTMGRWGFIFLSDAETAPCLRGNAALCCNGRLLLHVQVLPNTLENREGHGFLSVTRWGNSLKNAVAELAKQCKISVIFPSNNWSRMRENNYFFKNTFPWSWQPRVFHKE